MDILPIIADSLLVPGILAICAAVLVIGKSLLGRITKSVVAKNELKAMESEEAIRKQLIDTISTTVKAAVASNMSLRNEMKKDGHTLTEEEIAQLNENAKELIMKSLPAALTEEGGSLYEIIGGTVKLEALIKAMLEKYVYEYKITVPIFHDDAPDEIK